MSSPNKTTDKNQDPNDFSFDKQSSESPKKNKELKMDDLLNFQDILFQNKKLISNIEDLKNTLNECEQNCDRLELDKEFLKKELEVSKVSIKDEIGKYKQLIFETRPDGTNKQKSDMYDFEMAFQDLMNEIEDWKSKYKSEELAYKNAVVDYEALERSLEDKKKENIRIKNEIHLLKANLKQEKADKNASEEKVEEYLDKERRALLKLNEYTSQNQIIKKINEQRDELTTEVIQLKDEVQSLKMKLSTILDSELENKKLKKEIEKQQNNSKSHINTKFDNHNSSYDTIMIERVFKEKKELELDAKKDKNQIKYQENEIHLLKKKLNNYDEETKELKDKIEELLSKNNGLSKKKRELLEEVINIEASNEKDLQRLYHKNAMLENESKNLLFEIEKLIREKNILLEETHITKYNVSEEFEKTHTLELENSISKLNKNIYQSNEEIRRLNNDTTSQKKELNEKDAKIVYFGQFEQLYRDLKRQVSDQEFKVLTYTNQNEQQQKLITYYTSLEEKKEVTYKKEQNEKHLIINEMDDKNNEQESLKKIVEDRDWMIKNLKKQVNEFEEKIITTKKEEYQKLNELRNKVLFDDKDREKEMKREIEMLVDAGTQKDQENFTLVKEKLQLKEECENKIRNFEQRITQENKRGLDDLVEIHTQKLKTEIEGQKNEVLKLSNLHNDHSVYSMQPTVTVKQNNTKPDLEEKIKRYETQNERICNLLAEEKVKNIELEKEKKYYIELLQEEKSKQKWVHEEYLDKLRTMEDDNNFEIIALQTLNKQLTDDIGHLQMELHISSNAKNTIENLNHQVREYIEKNNNLANKLAMIEIKLKQKENESKKSVVPFMNNDLNQNLTEKAMINLFLVSVELMRVDYAKTEPTGLEGAKNLQHLKFLNKNLQYKEDLNISKAKSSISEMDPQASKITLTSNRISEQNKDDIEAYKRAKSTTPLNSRYLDKKESKSERPKSQKAHSKPPLKEKN